VKTMYSLAAKQSAISQQRILRRILVRLLRNRIAKRRIKFKGLTPFIEGRTILDFRTTMTLAVMAFVAALAALLILIQTPHV